MVTTIYMRVDCSGRFLGGDNLGEDSCPPFMYCLLVPYENSSPYLYLGITAAEMDQGSRRSHGIQRIKFRLSGGRSSGLLHRRARREWLKGNQRSPRHCTASRGVFSSASPFTFSPKLLVDENHTKFLAASGEDLGEHTHIGLGLENGHHVPGGKNSSSRGTPTMVVLLLVSKVKRVPSKNEARTPSHEPHLKHLR